MRVKLTSLCALLIGLFAAPAAAAGQGAGTVRGAGTVQDSTGVIQGRVYGRHGDRADGLVNAVLDVSSGSRHLTVLTDSSGAYVVRGIAPGAWRLRVLCVGYASMTAGVQVPPGGTVTLDLELAWRPVSLPPLVVEASPVRASGSTRPAPVGEMGEVALRALEGGAGMVEEGLAQVVRTLPGHDGSEPQDVLLMRGSATDLKLVLLDGAPVYTPFHMAGLVESFDPQALGGASLFLGGAPARFDGGLSYILDLQTRAPRTDGIHGSAAADLLTGRAFLEGPLTSSLGFLAGARTVHNLGSPFLAEGVAPYGYGDLLARLDWKGDGGGGAHLTGFWNRESVLLDLLSERTSAVSDAFEPPSNGEALAHLLPVDGAEWGNRAVSAGIRSSLGTTEVELGAAASRYLAELPLGDSVPLFARSRSDRVRFTADFSRPWGEGSLRFGASVDRQASAFSAVTLDSTQAPAFSRARLDGMTGGAYLEGDRWLTPSLRLHGGLRADRYEGEREVRLAPRIALTWMLTDAAALTLAGGRYHQYSNLTSQELEETLDPAEAAPADGSSPLLLSVGSANHLVVALDQILAPGLRLGLEGFVKKFSGLSAATQSGTKADGFSASGVDLRVAREGDRASGWLGYTLTWFWTSDGILASGNSPFSGRHLLSAGLNTRITDRTGLRIRASYGDGLPYTSVPVGRDGATLSSPSVFDMEKMGDGVLNEAPQLTAGPDEGFLRVELEVYGKWSPSFHGRSMELRPYVRVLNALNRRDALFYQFDPWRSERPEPLADLPVLPLLGLEWRF